MDVNLSALQDASASSYSSTVPKSSDAATSTAGVSVTPALDVKTSVQSDTTTDTGQDKQKELSKDELETVAEDLNKFMESLNTEIKFSIHEKTGRLMVRVMDSKNQVLKEFPSHQLLDTIAAISDYVGGLLDKKA
jgi:flagellar protein FlaG